MSHIPVNRYRFLSPLPYVFWFATALVNWRCRQESRMELVMPWWKVCKGTESYMDDSKLSSPWPVLFPSAYRLFSLLLTNMRVSTLFAAAATALIGLVAPVPTGYTWTITDWSGGHYGPLYANFYVSGPQTTSDVATLVTYTFDSGGTTHKITGLVASAVSGVSRSFTVTPNSLD
ncbi:hypothetical protein LA080_003847 [Diaporthe eres]|nr:hypothetical protein LA080_003847 [Diaporthe eres]